jgi:pimeloyl-ACP methyl ester carboxylesterase
VTLSPSSTAPLPRLVVAPDGTNIATYDFEPTVYGDSEAPVVIAIHGFASSATLNWVQSGWVRSLTRAGFRVVSFDQRGHGASDKPHHPDSYSMELLVGDLLTVLDTYLLDEVAVVGYSLGARVGWHAALELPTRVTSAVLGGIPDGDPLTRFRLDDAREFIASGTPVEDRLTTTYLSMAGGIEGNDLTALVDLVAGMRGGTQPDPSNPPAQPLLFATGTDDPIIEGSRALAASAPRGEFFEIPGRTHFNAPTSRPFRDRSLAFLTGQL